MHAGRHTYIQEHNTETESVTGVASPSRVIVVTMPPGAATTPMSFVFEIYTHTIIQLQ